MEEALKPAFEAPLCASSPPGGEGSKTGSGTGPLGEIDPVDPDADFVIGSDGTVAAMCHVSAMSGGSGGSGESVDIDTDSDNNWWVGYSQLEDDAEMTAPGNVIHINWDDDGNGTQDLEDDGPLASPDDELEVAKLGWGSGGALWPFFAFFYGIH